jgi:hypothetical protein
MANEFNYIKKEYSILINNFIQDLEMNTLDEYNAKWDNLINRDALNNSNKIWRKPLNDKDKGKLKRADCIFAIESNFKQKVLCKVFIGEIFVHEIILIPGTVQWIFNGCPIFTIALQYHEICIELYDIFTNEEMSKDFNKITIYYMDFFDNKLRCDLFKNESSCDLSDRSIFIFACGMGSICYNQNERRLLHFNKLRPLNHNYD